VPILLQREAEINDVCDFVIDYISSDVLVSQCSLFQSLWTDTFFVGIALHKAPDNCGLVSAPFDLTFQGSLLHMLYPDRPVKGRVPQFVAFQQISYATQEGTLDRSCIKLARLCSLAVDFPKRLVTLSV
jgi:hypothetical protein